MRFLWPNQSFRHHLSVLTLAREIQLLQTLKLIIQISAWQEFTLCTLEKAQENVESHCLLRAQTSLKQILLIAASHFFCFQNKSNRISSQRTRPASCRVFSNSVWSGSRLWSRTTKWCYGFISKGLPAAAPQQTHATHCLGAASLTSETEKPISKALVNLRVFYIN